MDKDEFINKLLLIGSGLDRAASKEEENLWLKEAEDVYDAHFSDQQADATVISPHVSDMLFDFAQFIWECDETHILDIYIEEYLAKNNYR